jgi:hypothetical protein
MDSIRELDAHAIIKLVKATQRHNIGSWASFLEEVSVWNPSVCFPACTWPAAEFHHLIIKSQQKLPQHKLLDPSKHRQQVRLVCMEGRAQFAWKVFNITAKFVGAVCRRVTGRYMLLGGLIHSLYST